MDRFGYARTIDTGTYESNRETVDEENRYVFRVMNTGRVCVFTSTGMMHTIKVMDLPLTKLRDKGVPIDNVSNYNSQSERYIYLCSLERLILTKLVFVTRKSMMKQVYGTEFDVTKRSVTATALLDGDELISVTPVVAEDIAILCSKEGYFLKFDLDEVPEKKKNAVGVRGMKLSAKDEVAWVFFYASGCEESVQIDGRPVDLSTLRLAKRDGKGSRMRK